MGGDMAYPSWGRIRKSLQWLWCFGLVSFPLGSAALVLSLLAARGLGWRAQYVPGAIGSLKETWGYVLHGLIAAPIVEELIYRGVVFPRLEKALSGGLSVFVSGFIFWALHWVDRGEITPWSHLLAGWILAWAALRTRSLLAPTLLHALGNLLVLGLDILWIQKPDFVRAILGG